MVVVHSHGDLSLLHVIRNDEVRFGHSCTLEGKGGELIRQLTVRLVSYNIFCRTPVG